jgi:hypothetical protein
MSLMVTNRGTHRRVPFGWLLVLRSVFGAVVHSTNLSAVFEWRILISVENDHTAVLHQGLLLF